MAGADGPTEAGGGRSENRTAASLEAAVRGSLLTGEPSAAPARVAQGACAGAAPRSGAFRDHWIVISLGFFCSAFGMCTLSTPSLLSQRIASALMLSGRLKARLKLP